MSRSCSHCGAKLKDEARYCPKCGLPVEPPRKPAGELKKPELTPEERRRNGLVILAVVLLSFSAIVALTFVIKGWLAGKDPRLGLYENTGSYLGELTLAPEGEWVELRRGGRLVISIDNKELKGKWTLDGREFRMKQGGEEFFGTLEEDRLTLTVSDRTFVFRRGGERESTVPVTQPETAPETTEETRWSVSEYAWWNGDFYGWWIAKDAGENWHSGQEFTFWDLCAAIEVDGAEGTVKLWDTDCAARELLGEVEVSFSRGTGEAGRLTSREGYFDLGRVGPGDWTAEPGYMGLSQLVCIEGSYEIYGVTRDYMIFLRPWGMSWEDIRNAPSSQRFFSDMMPAHYDDWYWPLARDGEEMPEYFVGLVFPQLREE